MSDWRPIETAPTGVYVQIGGWAPDRQSLGFYDAGGGKLEWLEGPRIAFYLNGKAIRTPSYPEWAMWWKPLDLNPPAPETDA